MKMSPREWIFQLSRRDCHVRSLLENEDYWRKLRGKKYGIRSRNRASKYQQRAETSQFLTTIRLIHSTVVLLDDKERFWSKGNECQVLDYIIEWSVSQMDLVPIDR